MESKSKSRFDLKLERDIAVGGDSSRAEPTRRKEEKKRRRKEEQQEQLQEEELRKQGKSKSNTPPANK